MLLSVLIPTYNYVCTDLVKDLSKQLPQDSEIIVADDGSFDSKCLQKNEEINQIMSCTYWKAEHNLGRAIIRNRLAEMAQGEWLIFMDCDARIINPLYLYEYLKNTDVDVVCGGTATPPQCPSSDVSLRYLYERNYWEHNNADKRNKSPYSSFTTFNFMIRKEVFSQIKFDENIHSYGHEDTLFGKALMDKKCSIRHIQNPLMHIGLENNHLYLKKTEEAMDSLIKLKESLSDTSRLLIAYHKLKKLHLITLIKVWHRYTNRLEKNNLCSSKPNLLYFKLYKLGYVSTHI